MQAFDLGCCCDAEPPSDCVLLSDTFTRTDDDSLGADWDERNGDFDIEGGVAKFKTAGGADPLVISTIVNADANLHVQATVFSQIAGTRFRLIIGYVDDSNYFFAEFHNHTSAGTLKLFERAAGVETELDTVDADIPHNTQCILTICCDGLFLYATVQDIDGSPNYGVDYVGATLTGGGWGFGINGNPIGTVWFDSVSAEKVEPGCAACDPINVDCDHCEDGDSPPYIMLVLDGFTDSTCTDCELLNGTFILTGGATGFGGNCFWTYQLPAPHCGSGVTGTAFTTLELVVTATAITLQIYWADVFSQGTSTFTLSISTPYDCTGISGLDIPFIEHNLLPPGFTTTHCDGTPTCTLTAL